VPEGFTIGALGALLVAPLRSLARLLRLCHRWNGSTRSRPVPAPRGVGPQEERVGIVANVTDR
jgi:hypothetical protein